MKKLLFTLLITTLITLFTSTFVVHAATYTYKPLVEIEGITTGAQPLTTDTILPGLYKTTITITIILAFVFFILNATRYLLSAANMASIDQARQGMKMSVLGLLLVLGSYLILQTINPELVKFTFLLKGVPPIEIKDMSDLSMLNCDTISSTFAQTNPNQVYAKKRTTCQNPGGVVGTTGTVEYYTPYGGTYAECNDAASAIRSESNPVSCVQGNTPPPPKTATQIVDEKQIYNKAAKAAESLFTNVYRRTENNKDIIKVLVQNQLLTIPESMWGALVKIEETKNYNIAVIQNNTTLSETKKKALIGIEKTKASVEAGKELNKIPR